MLQSGNFLRTKHILIDLRFPIYLASLDGGKLVRKWNGSPRRTDSIWHISSTLATKEAKLGNKESDALNGKGNPSVVNTCISPGCKQWTGTEWHIRYELTGRYGLVTVATRAWSAQHDHSAAVVFIWPTHRVALLNFSLFDPLVESPPVQ